MAWRVMPLARMVVMRSTSSGRSLTAGRPVRASLAGGGQALAGALRQPLAFPSADRGQRFGDELAAVGMGVDFEVEHHEPHARASEPVEQFADFGRRAGQARQLGDHQAVGLAAFQALQRMDQPRPLESLAVGRFGLADTADERPVAGRADGLDRPSLHAGLRFQRPVIRHADIAQSAHPRLRACGRGPVGHRGCGRGRPGRSLRCGPRPSAAASARAGARVWVAAPPPEARTGTGAGASATSAAIGPAVRSPVGTPRARRLRHCAPPTSSSARAITATATNTAIPTGSVLSVGVPRRCGVVAGIGGRCARGRCVWRRAGFSAGRRGGAAAGLSWRASRRVVWGPTMPSTASPCACWKRRTAASVCGPKRPSTGPGPTPTARSWRCSARTRLDPPARSVPAPRASGTGACRAGRVRGPTMPSTTSPRAD